MKLIFFGLKHDELYIYEINIYLIDNSFYYFSFVTFLNLLLPNLT